MKLFQEKALNAIILHRMISPRDKILVAISGGPDSIALLHFLKNSFPNIGLHAAHLNHGIRGTEADKDEAFVKKVCRTLGVPCTVKRMDINLLSKKMKLSIEETGRNCRYSFFNEVAEKIKAGRIALAHTADDNVETFLMRLVRGSGIKGLCGIPAVSGMIIRPLIDVWKSEVIQYCEDNSLEYRIDRTNFETKQFRNKVRNELIPMLWKYNPGIKEILSNTINSLSEDYGFIEEKARDGLKKLKPSPPAPSPRGRGEPRSDLGMAKIAISLLKLKKFSVSLQKHIVRLCIEELKGDLKEISFKHIQDILKLKEGQIHLPEGIIAVVKNGALTITDEVPKQQEKAIFEYKLKAPFKIKIKETGQLMNATFINKVPIFNRKKQNEAYADVSKLKGSGLTVRNFREGDSFVPFGMKGHKKVHDFFIDEKIPHDRRMEIPIVTDEEKIIWVAGYRLDDRVKIAKNTRNVLRLRLI